MTKAQRLVLIRDRHAMLRTHRAKLMAELDTAPDPEPDILPVALERDDDAMTPVYVTPPRGAEEWSPALAVFSD